MQELEYKELRREITARVQLLHQMVNLSVILTTVAVFIYFFVFGGSVEPNGVGTYIFMTAIVLSGLGFNYQANDMTLASLGKYLRQNYPESGWEAFWIAERKKYSIVSFPRVIALLLPQIAAVAYLFGTGWPTDSLDASLAVILLCLFAVTLFNFRYQIRND